MVSTDLYVAIILGLTLSLLFQEKFGINPGGLVVPGYLALTMDNPKSLIVILLLSLLTYMIVEFGLNKFIILYGRRRFLAMLMVCMILTNHLLNRFRITIKSLMKYVQKLVNIIPIWKKCFSHQVVVLKN